MNEKHCKEKGRVFIVRGLLMLHVLRDVWLFMRGILA